MRRALLLLVFLVPAAYAQRPPEQSLVLTASRALMVMEPRMAVAQSVLSFSTSPSGRYLVAVQEVPSERPLEIGKPQPEPKAKRIVVWDCTTGVSRDLVLPIGVTAARTQVEWFPGTDKALVSTRNDRVEITLPNVDGQPQKMFGRVTEWHILDAQSASMRKVHSDEGALDRMTRIDISPVSALAIKVLEVAGPRGEPDSIVAIQALRADGTWGAETKLSNQFANVGNTGWSPDGRTFQLEVSKRPDQPGRWIPRVVTFDPATGNITEVVGPVPSYEPKTKVRDVSVTYVVTPLESPSEKRMVATWWLTSAVETKNTKAVIAEHAMMAELPQGERFVAFVANGTLFTRQIIQLSIEQYEQMRVAAERAAILSRGKQMGLAFAMYATDYDNAIGPDFKLSDLQPYVKNNSIMEGFVMVFPGGRLADVKDPANTVLGYIDGPDGRAVVYLDSHVKWENKGG